MSSTLVVIGVSASWAQTVSLEAAIQELFGGAVVIGEVPEIVAASIPLLDGVEVVATHVAGDGFTAILSSRRDAGSLVSEYAGVLTLRGWRVVSGPEEEELRLCSRTDDLIRVAPSIGRDEVRARVAFEPDAPACQTRALLAGTSQNDARQILMGAGMPPGCGRFTGGAGSGGSESSSWNLTTTCDMSVPDVAAHYAARWRQRGWERRVEDDTATQHVSGWQVPDLRGRPWYAVFQVRSGPGENPTTILLSLSAAESGHADGLDGLRVPLEVHMRYVGRSFVFDYGDLVIRVRYLSESRLEWEQTKGPQAGSKGEEQFDSSEIRDDIVYFWWREKDSSVFAQVVDFGRGVVHTTWISPDGKPAGFQGKVRSLE